MFVASLSRRFLSLLGFAFCVAALSVAILFMEMYLGLEPCPLCVIDRIIVAAIGAVFLLAALHNPGAAGYRVYAAINLVSGALGVAVAARHIWLQNLPPALVPDCAPGLDYLVTNFPLAESLSVIWNTSGNCAEIAWTFLGLSIPWQTLLLFVALLALNLWIIFCRDASDDTNGNTNTVRDSHTTGA